MMDHLSIEEQKNIFYKYYDFLLATGAKNVHFYLIKTEDIRMLNHLVTMYLKHR